MHSQVFALEEACMHNHQFDLVQIEVQETSLDTVLAWGPVMGPLQLLMCRIAFYLSLCQVPSVPHPDEAE